jgi:4-hydroxy-3-polyprenylbenzoate decarboxylase
VGAAGLHAEYQARSRNLLQPQVIQDGKVLQQIKSSQINLHTDIPTIKHFASDRGPYITNSILISEFDGISNVSYHRSMVHSDTEIATSLHSRGHLWRMLQAAETQGKPLPVAMVIGAHPLFMLAAAARLPTMASMSATWREG